MELSRLARIDTAGLDPRLARTGIKVACNPYNVLCGERGVARVFGPQKGDSPERVEQLAAGLERWAAVPARDVAPGRCRLADPRRDAGEGHGQVPGVDAHHSILPAPVGPAEALGRGAEFLTGATERALRMVLLGARLGPVAACAAPLAVAVGQTAGTQRPSTVR